MSAGKVIIVGASSGIGSALAKVFAAKGYDVGLTARRLENLEAIKKDLPGNVHICRMNVADYQASRECLKNLVNEMGGMDILVLNAGIGDSKPTWEREIEIINTNAAGFTALANYAYQYFTEKGGGQIVGISSVASVRGTRIATVYSATKAYISSYMEGLRQHARNKKNGVVITDIRPGFVATPMTEQNKGMFWVATAEKAARQVYEAIVAKKDVAYITRRWALIAWLVRRLPDFVFYRM
jgi:short-subunit dehydrogenase